MSKKVERVSVNGCGEGESQRFSILKKGSTSGNYMNAHKYGTNVIIRCQSILIGGRFFEEDNKKSRSREETALLNAGI